MENETPTETDRGTIFVDPKDTGGTSLVAEVYSKTSSIDSSIDELKTGMEALKELKSTQSIRTFEEKIEKLNMQLQERIEELLELKIMEGLRLSDADEDSNIELQESLEWRIEELKFKRKKPQESDEDDDSNIDNIETEESLEWRIKQLELKVMKEQEGLSNEDEESNIEPQESLAWRIEELELKIIKQQERIKQLELEQMEPQESAKKTEMELQERLRLSDEDEESKIEPQESLAWSIRELELKQIEPQERLRLSAEEKLKRLEKSAEKTVMELQERRNNEFVLKDKLQQLQKRQGDKIKKLEEENLKMIGKFEQLHTENERSRKANEELKEELQKVEELISLPWVEGFKRIGGHDLGNEPRLEIICKIGKVPDTNDIVKLFGEENISFITYKKLSRTEWLEKNILDENMEMKEEYAAELLSLEWVKCLKLVMENDDHHVEIVYKFGKAPQVSDIVNIFGKNILPFISFQEGSKDEWFEESVLDENYDMKEFYVNELLSDRFPSVKDFYISVTSDPEESWQIFLTYARNTVPSMKDLKKLFGVKICSFVDFKILGSDTDKKPLTSSCFLRAPSSGDSLYVQNKERGTIGILATRISDTDDHYAVTCYHVCYCESELPEFIHDAHDTLKKDWGSNASVGCFATKCHYINKDTELGNFGCGLYDDKNDIALIELAPDLTCDDATTLLKDGVESKLLGKKEVGKLFREYQKKGEDIFPKVKKFGSVTKETEGELYAISGAPKPNGMNNGFYRIRGTGGNDFAEKGDSGSLVYLVDEGKNFPFAIVSNKDPDDDVYYCPNLLQSIVALGKEYRSIRIQPCLNQCGRTSGHDIESTEKQD